jgi:ATP/maltotriose-dependent transcriptional regulator MalT
LVFARIATLAQTQSQRRQLPEVRLTRREHEVLQLLANGYRNGEIAYQLGVALDTVKRHVANICKKFHVRGRRVAIQRAYEYGVLKEAGTAQLVGVSGSSSRG